MHVQFQMIKKIVWIYNLYVQDTQHKIIVKLHQLIKHVNGMWINVEIKNVQI